MHDTIFSRRGYSRGLRDACRKALTSLVILLGAATAYSQTIYPNNLSVDSAAPSMDTVVLAQIRAKLDSVRRTQGRPTVALVLSGGGAKGAAHVGAMKVIEEMQIPIDVVCGTSIGGLVGGLYALGYSPQFIDSLFHNQDWGLILSDRVADKYIPYSTKEYRSKYVLSIPFKYSKEVLDKKHDFMNSMPSGYCDGLNVNALLSSLSVGYQDSIAFANLPIPFCCVAADMVSCKAKNFGSGYMGKAMRSTMSIPGLFAPVRYDGMVLVDGGTRNNYPTDIARAVGADYIIGIELGDARPTYSEINHLGHLLTQFISMLGKDALDKNLSQVDVYIKPSLDGYNMLSFNPEAVDSMVARGYNAALLKKDDLQKIKDLMPYSTPHLNNLPARDLGTSKVYVRDIVFKGVDAREEDILERRLKLKPGTYMGKKELDEAISKLKGCGAFESVTYRMQGSYAPFVLEFDCKKAPVHQFGLGLRADTEEWAAILLNLSFNARKLSAPRVDLQGKLSTSQYLDARFSLDLMYIPTINVGAKVGNYRGKMSIDNTSTLFDTGYFTHQESLYLSNLHWTMFDFNFGVRYRYFKMRDDIISKMIAALYGAESLYGGYSGLFFNCTAYTFDDWYYPSQGLKFKLFADYDFAKTGSPSFKPILNLGADFKIVIPCGDIFAIIPDLHARFADVKNDDKLYSFAHKNFYGGFMADRYIDNQTPMVGINNIAAGYDHMAILNADFRFKVIEHLYASAKASYMRGSYNFETFYSSSAVQHYGFAVECGYNSIAGPLRLNVSWSDFSKWSFFVSLGCDF